LLESLRLPGILICASESVERELHASPVWRNDLERAVARNPTEALAQAGVLKPRLIVVDRDLQLSEFLVRQLRTREASRSASILIVAAGEMSIDELGLLDAGANSVLRLPPGPEWDSRVEALLRVPTRKDSRIEVDLRVRGEAEEQAIRGRALNVSSTGMLVQTAVALSVSSEVAFRLELPGFATSSGEVEGRARVVRQSASGEYGMSFVEMEPIGAEMLRRFLSI
jgi:DNA-binding response OmpR family regulator